MRTKGVSTLGVSYPFLFHCLPFHIFLLYVLSFVILRSTHYIAIVLETTMESEGRPRRTSTLPPETYRQYLEVSSSSDDDGDLIYNEEDLENLSIADIQLLDETSNQEIIEGVPYNPVHSLMPSTSHARLSQSGEASSSSTSRRRSALEAGSEELPEESPAKRVCEDEEDKNTRIPHFSLNTSSQTTDNECIICTETWTNSGHHRLVCLKCGHCFGQSCIERWITQSRPRNEKAKCPHCMAVCCKKDIRPIFAKALRALDTHERDKFSAELEAEKDTRLRVQKELILANNKIVQLQDENQQLKKSLLDLQSSSSRIQAPLVDHSRRGRGSARFVRDFATFRPFQLNKVIEIDSGARCRVMASSKNLETIAVSLPSSSPVFKGAGVKRIDTNTGQVSNYVPIHSELIKDMVFKPDDALLLTASDDCTMKLTSLVRNSVETTFKLPETAWSCCWHPIQRNVCFVGLKNGVIQEFDIRRPNCFMKEFKMDSPMPLISVQCVHNSIENDENSCNSAGILCNTLKNAYFITLDSVGSQTSIQSLGLEGSFLPSYYDHESGVGVITQRASSRTKTPVTHNLLSFPVNEAVSFRQTACFHGGNLSDNLSRPKVFCDPDSFNRKAIIFAGDEESRGMICYDSESKKIQQRIPTPHPVMDIDVILSGGVRGMRVAALTKTGISFFERAQ